MNRRGPRASPSLDVLQSEDVEHGARLHLLQLGRRVDEPLVPGAAQADEDRDILLAVYGERHRRRAHAAAGVEAPELLQRLAVEREHFSGRFAGEYQFRGRQSAAEERELGLVLARDL